MLCASNKNVGYMIYSKDLLTFVRVNYFLARFGHLSHIIKCHLFNNYCHSLYGSLLCKLSQSGLSDFEIA